MAFFHCNPANGSTKFGKDAPFRLLPEGQRAWCDNSSTSNVLDFRCINDTVVPNALNAGAISPDLSDEEKTVFLKSLACVVSHEDRILNFTSDKLGLGRDGLEVSANSRVPSGGHLRLFQGHFGTSGLKITIGGHR